MLLDVLLTALHTPACIGSLRCTDTSGVRSPHLLSEQLAGLVLDF
jgi:hypothetical protein